MKKLVLAGGIAAASILALEMLCFVVLRVLVAKNYLVDPDRWEESGLEYSRYLRIRHPDLGWPYRQGRQAPGGAYRDETGARRLAAFPDPTEPSCVSIYGDSFAESIEVDAEHAWSNLIAKGLDCRVANFGQASYGSDQALLRHRLNLGDEAPIVILTHMTENLARNLTRLRDLSTRTQEYAFKPRFIVDAAGKARIDPLVRPERSQVQTSRWT